MKKENISSKERVHASVKGLPIDRVPVFYWINAHAGAKLMAAYKKARRTSWNLIAKFLWDRFDRPEPSELWRLAPMAFDVHVFNWANAYSLELGADMVLASFATPWWYSKFIKGDGRILMKDIYGATRAIGNGIYPDTVKPAIADPREISSYQLPDPRPDKLYNIFRRYRRDYPQASIAAEIWGAQDFGSHSLFGMEKFMVNLIDYPDEMKALMRRFTDFHVEVIRRSVAAGADSILILDDYGYNFRPLISMDMWKEFSYPGLKRLIDTAHECGALAGLHSCGYQVPFLPHYVEAGLDFLHAFQPKAGNDFGEAYAKFGDKLAFVTGIDTQRGEFMSAAEFREEIIANYRIGGLKGRHILGTSHEIQHTMSIENTRTIFDTVAEIQAGVHDLG